MLVLSRKLGQSVFTSYGIQIKIIKQKGNEIVLGITAPKDVRIWREELEKFKDQLREPRVSRADEDDEECCVFLDSQ